MFWGQVTFPEEEAPIMYYMDLFHDFSIIILTLIFCYILTTMTSLTLNKSWMISAKQNHSLETWWTLIPGMILVLLALPSLHLLYLMDESYNPLLTVKAIGHQWYWTYEFTDFKSLEFDAYMTPTEDLAPGHPRLLETDNRLTLPTWCEVRMLITSADVLHSWTVPSMGIKADATPGRLNQATLIAYNGGVHYGQCSEICGANHSFMPIALETVEMNLFCKKLNNMLTEQ